MTMSKEERQMQLIAELLETIGEDPNREGLKGTPDRIMRMWKEIFRGYDPEKMPKITTKKTPIKTAPTKA